MDLQACQTLCSELVAELLPQTTIADPSRLEVQVRDDPAPDAFTHAFVPAGAEALFLEAGRDAAWEDFLAARIVVTTGLVNALTRPRLRALLAHEMAHVEAGDHLSEDFSPATRLAMEVEADRRGVEIGGDGPSLACGLLHIFREVAPETAEHIATHGPVARRANAIGAQMAADLGL